MSRITGALEYSSEAKCHHGIGLNRLETSSSRQAGQAPVCMLSRLHKMKHSSAYRAAYRQRTLEPAGAALKVKALSMAAGTLSLLTINLHRGIDSASVVECAVSTASNHRSGCLEGLSRHRPNQATVWVRNQPNNRPARDVD